MLDRCWNLVKVGNNHRDDHMAYNAGYVTGSIIAILFMFSLWLLSNALFSILIDKLFFKNMNAKHRHVIIPAISWAALSISAWVYLHNFLGDSITPLGIILLPMVTGLMFLPGGFIARWWLIRRWSKKVSLQESDIFE